MAYTWFTRLTALRYLDARGWHPFKARVLTPSSPEETQPELLRLARGGAVPDDLRQHVNVQRISALLEGRLASSDAQGEAYRHLVLGTCRFYHKLLPDLFERLDDETELLMPDDLLTEHSIAHGFRVEVNDADCAEVEIIGWLYQFYISEKKDAVMARKSTVPREDIPAVTQLFTPHWIVRYLVENSIGRLWLLNRPNSRLRQQMPYYLDGGDEPDYLRIARPEDIRVIDPAVGSGHMLTYAFDLLHAIYEEEGYAQADIPGLILKHNLFGVDIDPRAAQLATLALVLKARERSRRFLQPGELQRPNVIALQDVHFDDRELDEYVRALDLGELFSPPVLGLLKQFHKATTFGSLVRPTLGERDIRGVSRQIDAKELGSQLFLTQTHHKVLRVLEQAAFLTQRYHVVVANPPYMGSNKFNVELKDFTEENFPTAKSDLYTCFMLRNIDLLDRRGLCAMITLPNWMFLSSFDDLRLQLLSNHSFHSLLHNGRGLWGGDFGSTAFILDSYPDCNRLGRYKRLFDKQGEINSVDTLEKRFFDDEKYPPYLTTTEVLQRLPGAPIAYWVTAAMARLFSEAPPLNAVGDPRQGLATGDNDQFLRYWWEPARSRIAFGAPTPAAAMESGRRWFPHHKGGAFRKWYGNHEYVIDWEDDGTRIRNFVDSGGRLRSRPQNLGYSFRECMTWSTVTISRLSMRYSPPGFICGAKGSGCFFEDRSTLLYSLALMNTEVVDRLLLALAPTADYSQGPIGRVPYIEANKERICDIASACVAIAKGDWDSYEQSWEFVRSPLLSTSTESLKNAWLEWVLRCRQDALEMKRLETLNNELFIETYGLQHEVSPDVPMSQITLSQPDQHGGVVHLLSYIVGCIMGRYGLDAPGLIIAERNETVADYVAKVGKPFEDLSFAPDQDGIVPMLDDEWFDEDVVSRIRDFIRLTFGERNVRDNVRFIEESLGKDLRKYFLSDFYKDHLQTYKKRPIYWMVQSPKKGFSALIYLHRYNKDTLNVVLNRYLREYLVKLRARIAHLERVQAAPGTAAREVNAARKEADRLSKVLHECEEWERNVLLPLAQARIELDLDDGVKVNYLKLADVLAPIPGLAKAED